jgi:SAM-dependent methyltransferase
VTAVEVDEQLAAALKERLAGTNVEVIYADATATGLEADRFSTVTSFSMLHHMPSAGHQDRLFAELHRVLRPGGAFVGTDSLDLEPIRAGHVDDTFVPIEPDSLATRLAEAGFGHTTVEVGEYQFRFRSQKGDSETAAG